jgi:hypothetical protein|tara:strand:+ start:73 stop:312 length:240 start_codon:yes stop_codon:yes gene_type:complete
MKIFKCVLWVNCNILRELNKDMPTKATRYDEPFPIETKYIEIESYEKLRKTYNITPFGFYCLIEEVDSLPKKDAIEVSS